MDVVRTALSWGVLKAGSLFCLIGVRLSISCMALSMPLAREELMSSSSPPSVERSQVDFSGQVARGLVELLGVEAEGLVHVELGTIHR